MDPTELTSDKAVSMLGWMALWLVENPDLEAEAWRITDNEPDDAKAAILLRRLLEPRLVALKKDDDIFNLTIDCSVMGCEAEMLSVDKIP